MRADEVVRQLLDDPEGADLVRDSLGSLVQQLSASSRSRRRTSFSE